MDGLCCEALPIPWELDCRDKVKYLRPHSSWSCDLKTDHAVLLATIKREKSLLVKNLISLSQPMHHGHGPPSLAAAELEKDAGICLCLSSRALSTVGQLLWVTAVPISHGTP